MSTPFDERNDHAVGALTLEVLGQRHRAGHRVLCLDIDHGARDLRPTTLGQVQRLHPDVEDVGGRVLRSGGPLVIPVEPALGDECRPLVLGVGDRRRRGGRRAGRTGRGVRVGRGAARAMGAAIAAVATRPRMIFFMVCVVVFLCGGNLGCHCQPWSRVVHWLTTNFGSYSD